MINVVVPPDQIIDTVDLFYLPVPARMRLPPCCLPPPTRTPPHGGPWCPCGRARATSRFLAWHLLGQQMSNRLQDTHDSIEDARTALQEST